MYKIKKIGSIKFLFGDNKSMAKKIGISHISLWRILNGKANTTYKTAYCIVKLYDPEKEVLDYFKII